jgi:hypothetical protein
MGEDRNRDLAELTHWYYFLPRIVILLIAGALALFMMWWTHA